MQTKNENTKNQFELFIFFCTKTIPDLYLADMKERSKKLYSQLLSRSSRVSFGGPGKFKITNCASCDLFTITSFNLTAVCIRRTLSSSLNGSTTNWWKMESKMNLQNWKKKCLKKVEKTNTYGLMLCLVFSSVSDCLSESFSLFASSANFNSSFSLNSLAGCADLFGDEWLLKLLLSESFSPLSAASFSVSYSAEPFSVASILLESFSFWI